MPQQLSQAFTYTRFANRDELPTPWLALLVEAETALQNSYSPYSHFKVGCALRLATGRTVRGSNQENVAYPSGLCAERSAFFSFGSNRQPDDVIEAVAITTLNQEREQDCAYSCGSCRQSMLEFETAQGQPIPLLMAEKGGTFVLVNSLADMLPLVFSF